MILVLTILINFLLVTVFTFTLRYSKNEICKVQPDEAKQRDRGLLSTQQDRLMREEQCLIVDENDRILGRASKRDAHIFSDTNPGGLLHRAFSVFLFDEKNRLLLQQRAATKITFPNFWTNTCCSHPIYDFGEADDDAEVLSGRVMGVRSAAVRKLENELGIVNDIAKMDFKYITRLHYISKCDDDVGSGSSNPAKDVWGEHEIDYLLLVRKANVLLKPNPEEVQNTIYVTQDELLEMMRRPDLKWTPWFRIVVDEFLLNWWNDLDAALGTDQYVNYDIVHRFH